MSGTTMTATILGVDKASPVLDKVGDSASRTGGKFASAAKLAAGALAGISVVSFFKDSVSAFVDAQAQTQKLQDAFAKFPKLGDSTAEAIEKISASLEAKTRYDDDATNGAAALLAQFDLTGKQVEQLIPLVQDYATATGKDLNTAAQDLGKAFMGQTRALKEVGVNYKSTGDQAQDFTNIVGLLQEKVGGFAENEGRTAAGQLEIMKNQFGEVQESIGSVLLPVIIELGKITVPILQSIATGAGEVVDVIHSIPGPVLIAVAAFVGFKTFQQTKTFEKLSTAVSGFREQMAAQKGIAAAQGVELSTMGAAASTAKMKLGDLARTIGPSLGLAAAAVGIGLIVAQFTHVNQQVEAVKSNLNDLAGALVKNKGRWDETIDAMRRQQAESSDTYKAMVAAGLDAGDSLAFLTGHFEAMSVTVDDFQHQMGGGIFPNLDRDTIVAALNMASMNDAVRGTAASIQAMDDRQAAAAASTHVYASSMEEARTAATKTRDAYDAYAFSTSNVAAMQDESKASAVVLKQKWDDLANTPNLITQSQLVADKVKATADAMAAANDRAHDLTSASSELEVALAKLSGREPTVEQATRAFNGALTDAVKAAHDGQDGFAGLGAKLIDTTGIVNTATPAGQKLYDTVTSMGKAAQDAAIAQGSLAGATGGTQAAADAANKSLAESRQHFLDNAKQMGLTALEAQKLADKYFGIPKDITTVVKGVANFADVDAKLQRLADTTIAIPVKGEYTGLVGAPSHSSGLVARASGGPTYGGRDYLVGERGPEILRMAIGASGWVYNNAQTRSTSGLPARASGGPVSGGDGAALLERIDTLTGAVRSLAGAFDDSLRDAARSNLTLARAR